MPREMGAIFRGQEIQCRDYNEMVGICKGIIADGKVCAKEAAYLCDWLESHPDVAAVFPGNILADRLAGMLADGNLDAGEAEELLHTLRDLTGEKGQQGRGSLTTSLGFDDPMPRLTVAGQIFCCTGTFASGERAAITIKLSSLGAEVIDRIPKRKPCFLVVGSLVTESWKFSTHGRKLEEAVTLRNDGYPISVISEDHLWNEFLRLGLPL